MKGNGPKRQPEIHVGHKEPLPAMWIIKQHWNQKPRKGSEPLPEDILK
jgi:hypothetical protein